MPLPKTISLAFLGLFLVALACSSQANSPEPCVQDGRTLNVGFYAFFEPVSYSANETPDSDGFNTHLGYEADLLTALETMEDAALTLSRRGIVPWPDIWLLSATPEFDVVGGGITILDSRTRDDTGATRIAFTRGHIEFRQSLLVRSQDADRFTRYSDLTSDVRIGVLAGTTGEFRLLEITGLVNADGVLAPGTRIETPEETLTSDGSAAFAITPAGASPNLIGRRLLHPASEAMPQVIYLGEREGESELLDALESGAIDTLARGEVGNRNAAHGHSDLFVVSVLDDKIEHGGFTVNADDSHLLSCLNERIDWLTDNRAIGYAQWLEDPSVFILRASLWNEGKR